MADSDFLPLELDVESIIIEQTPKGWEYTLEREDGDAQASPTDDAGNDGFTDEAVDNIVLYEEMPDATYDQLHEAGILTIEDGEVVQS